MNQEYKFKFDKFPKLLEMFEIHEKLNLNAVKYSMKESIIGQKKYIIAEKKYQDFSLNNMAKAVYDTFCNIKPLLHQRRGEDCYLKWDEVFDRPFDELDVSQRKYLVGLLRRKFVYELPDDYYND